MRASNKAFKVAGIRNLIKTNYGLAKDLFDIEALVDNSLSMAVNWSNIKPLVLPHWTKKEPCFHSSYCQACSIDFRLKGHQDAIKIIRDVRSTLKFSFEQELLSLLITNIEGLSH